MIKQDVRANKATKEIKPSHTKYSINQNYSRKRGKREPSTDGTNRKQQEDGRWKPNHIDDYIKCKLSKYLS